METENKYIIIDADIVADVARNPHIEDEEYVNFQYYSDGEYPRKLIDEVRPNEHIIVKEYRKKTYEAVFSEVYDRVLNALNKIQRADGFFLKFPDTQYPRIAKDEDLKTYLTKNFTASKSLMNWAFQVGLKQYTIDANGVIIVWAEQAEPTEYKKPKPYVINSSSIVYHYEGNSIVYKDDDNGNVYYSIDKISWSKWRKKKKGNGFDLVEETLHGLGVFPGFTIGGVVEEEEELGREYQSRLKAMLPWLNVATVEFSDLRAEITQHIHSTVWIYQDEQCKSCNGQGFTFTKEQERVPCTNSKCKDGQIPTSPYETIRVRPAKTTMGEVPAPTPPMGYIQKQTEIAELQDKRINEMRYRSLAAINMQFLEAQPAAQSGVAKAYDRDETNNTFYGVAVDIGTIMTNIAELCAMWRYKEIYDVETIKSMVPVCVVPNQFDILGSQLILEEIKAAKDSGLNDAVLSAQELEYIVKRFPNDIAMQDMLRDAFNLDPASGKTQEEKALLVSNKMLSKTDAVISTYIQDFVQRAYAENPEFNRLDKSRQQAVLNAFAVEKLKEINTKDILFNQIFNINETETISGGKSPADLKYTVGGLTGIIEIVKAVSSGVYDLEAAIQMVMDRFGLTYEQARAQLGTPQIITSDAQLDKITQLT
jgi:hypothetical protein